MKSKIKSIDAEIANLKSIQEYCKKKNGYKNEFIKIKIAFMSSLKEFVINGKIKSHKGILKDGRLIEDFPNKNIRKYAIKAIKKYLADVDSYRNFANIRLANNLRDDTDAKIIFFYADNLGNINTATNLFFVAKHPKCVAVKEYLVLEKYGNVNEFLKLINGHPDNIATEDRDFIASIDLNQIM